MQRRRTCRGSNTARHGQLQCLRSYTRTPESQPCGTYRETDRDTDREHRCASTSGRKDRPSSSLDRSHRQRTSQNNPPVSSAAQTSGVPISLWEGGQPGVSRSADLSLGRGSTAGQSPGPRARSLAAGSVAAIRELSRRGRRRGAPAPRGQARPAACSRPPAPSAHGRLELRPPSDRTSAEAAA